MRQLSTTQQLISPMVLEGEVIFPPIARSWRQLRFDPPESLISRVPWTSLSLSISGKWVSEAFGQIRVRVVVVQRGYRNSGGNERNSLSLHERRSSSSSNVGTEAVEEKTEISLSLSLEAVKQWGDRSENRSPSTWAPRQWRKRTKSLSFTLCLRPSLHFQARKTSGGLSANMYAETAKKMASLAVSLQLA